MHLKKIKIVNVQKIVLISNDKNKKSDIILNSVLDVFLLIVQNNT